VGDVSEPATATHYDAIVVGSGITGGWAAKELTEAGLRTLVLERGRNVEHVKDYPTANLHPWELPHGNRPTQQDLADYHVQKDLYLFGQDSKHFLVKDVDHPYNAVRDFRWFRGYQVGGRSLLWARHCFRWSDKHLRDRLVARFPERRLISSRAAVLSRPHNGRGKCMSRNLCHRGCPYGAYFSSNSSTLPAAAATGRLTLRPFSIAHSIVTDAGTGRATGVRVIDAETHQRVDFFAPVIFLNASALNTTGLMLNSVSRHHPRGFANSSGVLGRYLMDHHAAVGATATFDGYADRYYAGRRSTSVYIPRFRNLDARSRHAGYTRGFAYEVYTGRQGWQDWKDRARQPDGHVQIGAALKATLTRPGPWWLYLEAFGECLPRRQNKVTLNHDKPDKWGMPTLDIDMSYGPNELTMRKDMESSAVEMLTAAGLQSVKGFSNEPHPGEVIHEMGTARMGARARDSVVGAFNQCHDSPNVFVTDGACMTSSACQNPSLTYMALTARACAHAVKELRRGAL
jgi:choline dehydrogenase-like flavoprotein